MKSFIIATIIIAVVILVIFTALIVFNELKHTIDGKIIANNYRYILNILGAFFGSLFAGVLIYEMIRKK